MFFIFVCLCFFWVSYVGLKIVRVVDVLWIKYFFCNVCFFNIFMNFFRKYYFYYLNIIYVYNKKYEEVILGYVFYL